MPEDLMRYDLLAQNALKGVVRDALRIAATSGLPGEHHFFIAFDTRHPGVILSPEIASRYPREMTIVLQHKYWNLNVSDERFEVELSFENIPQKLVIPFDAVKGFLDPAVQFGLQFETVSAERKLKEVEAPKPDSANAGDGDQIMAATVPPETAGQDEAAKVVTLDHFRKK